MKRLKDVLRIFLFVFVVVTDASYVTITSSGYQDLVVRMEEDPGTALDCAGTLEYVKVSPSSHFEYNYYTLCKQAWEESLMAVGTYLSFTLRMISTNLIGRSK